MIYYQKHGNVHDVSQKPNFSTLSDQYYHISIKQHFYFQIHDNAHGNIHIVISIHPINRFKIYNLMLGLIFHFQICILYRLFSFFFLILNHLIPTNLFACFLWMLILMFYFGFVDALSMQFMKITTRDYMNFKY